MRGVFDHRDLIDSAICTRAACAYAVPFNRPCGVVGLVHRPGRSRKQGSAVRLHEGATT